MAIKDTMQYPRQPYVDDGAVVCHGVEFKNGENDVYMRVLCDGLRVSTLSLRGSLL